MPRRPRILLIGLDGGTFEVLNPLMEENLMPHLAALRREGAWGTLLSTMPPFTVPAWTSFLTGKQPGKHGVLSFFRRERTAYHCQEVGHFVNARAIPGETLGDILGAEGVRVGLVNIPMTYPPRPLPGYCITGMLTPPGAKDFTYPPSLRERLGEYQVDLEGMRREDRFAPEAPADRHRFIAQVAEMTRQRGEICLRLLREDPVDLFAVVFTGTDRLAHEFWPQLAAGCPLDDPFGPSLRAYFGELDAYIGRLVAAAPEAYVLILSDHGFGPAPEQRFLVNRWLEEQGWLRRRGQRAGGLRGQAGRLLARAPALRQTLRRLLPAGWQEQARQAVHEEVVNEVDWAHTWAYFTPLYGYVGGISLNRRGVKPQGIVEENAVPTLTEEILAALQQVVDPQTYRPIVRQVFHREDLYRGPYVENLPEVVFVLDPAYNAHYTLRSRAVIEGVPHRRRHGEHRREGILFLHGPSVRPGPLPRPAEIVDVLPTMLYLLGLPLPDDLDGRVVVEALDPAHLDTQPVRMRPARPASLPPEEAFAEEAAVEERLRGLGYL